MHMIGIITAMYMCTTSKPYYGGHKCIYDDKVGHVSMLPPLDACGLFGFDLASYMHAWDAWQSSSMRMQFLSNVF